MLRRKYESKRAEYYSLQRKVDERNSEVKSLKSKLTQSENEIQKLVAKVHRYEVIFQNIKGIADSAHEQTGQIIGMTSVDYLQDDEK